MLNWVFVTIDTLALGASCLALAFVVRLRSTYFLSSRLFIGIANFAFIVILMQSIAVDTGATIDPRRVYYSMIAVTVVSLGFASYLMRSNGLSSLRGLKSSLFRPSLDFAFYLLLVSIWTVLTLGTDYDSYELASMAANAILLVAFLSMPVFTFYRQSRFTRDPKAASAIRTISMAWASFGIVAFVQAAIPPYDSLYPMVQSLGQLSNGVLFVIITIALREPTVLSRMIVAVAQSDRGFYFGNTKSSIVLYNMESDRRRIVEEFLSGRVTAADPVICCVAKSDVPFYRAILQDLLQIGDGKEPPFIIRAIESATLATTSAIELSKSRRELVDLGDLDQMESRRFIEDRRKLDQTGRTPQSRVWTVSVDASRKNLIDEIVRLNPGAEIVDLAANQNAFSQRLGIVHQSLLGARILMEYDPTADYERMVKEFAGEFVSNVEPVAVFTSLGSPVYRQLQDRQSIRLFVFSSKISTPSRVTEAQVLLPERDTSLLIDAVDKLVQAHKGRQIGLVVEGFTDLILSQGFEKSYGVLSSILEMAEVGSSTAMVLINRACLDEKTLQGLRGLFWYNLQYGSEGLRQVKMLRPSGAPENEGSNFGNDDAQSWSVVS